MSALGPHPFLLFAGFLAVGTASAALYALSTRPEVDPRSRRTLSILWVLVLLAGGPLWLVTAAGLGLL